MSACTTISGTDGRARCRWCAAAPEFEAYHDAEWGFPVSDDIRLFEKLCLESFQSGLSWRTILNKRENFRRAFHGFNFHKMARYGSADRKRLLLDKGIVRHQGKIEAVIHNALCAVQLQAEYGTLAAYFWQFEVDSKNASPPQTASVCAESIALAKDLKKRGWKFVGPTTVYAFMQAMGLINDHVADCVTAQEVARARKKFIVPVKAKVLA